MRIVIDMQGAQSTGSRDRGIGRYSLSLALAMIRNRGAHEVHIALSNLFPDTIEPICSEFSGLLPRENIRTWDAPASLSKIDAGNDWRREVAECLREAFLASLKPDVILLTSLFEGLVDDAVTSIGKLGNNPPTAMVLYDLIPWIHQKPYLDNPAVRTWYEEKIGYLRQAQLWLSISESSRQEGLTHLNLPKDAVVNISTAADAKFCRKDIAEPLARELRSKYGLTRPFLMYTGGIDHRKNIEGLIRAYATIPVAIRAAHQLAIVCSIQAESKSTLEQLAKEHGLNGGELVLTGFVPEGDLIALYHLCKAFVFPSWHEGFGLPALEAMHCGAPVIAANTSSLPEVVGNDEALFDPYDDQAIAAKIIQVLTDDAFRQRLIAHGLQQAQKFSWDLTAKRAIAAFETMCPARDGNSTIPAVSAKRPKLAFVSPLPPERCGIADYSAELLPELAQHYDIDVIVAQRDVTSAWVKGNLPIRTVEWFQENGAAYERVLYHFGNSPFHEHMFGLLEEHPGVVVLHDFCLGHIQSYRESSGRSPGVWARELGHSHGFMASRRSVNAKDPGQIAFQYPCNWSILQQATGVIIHSSHPKRLAEEWYGTRAAESWAVIPLLRKPPNESDRSLARQALGFTNEDFVVVSFGMLGPTKLNHELLDAWLASALSEDKHCHLVFVGENHEGEYGADLRRTISKSGLKRRIQISGWVDDETYRSYLAASDLGVQLRTLSRGETSAAVLDCLNYGVPTIVNANGSMSDLPSAAVHMLSDEFQLDDLTSALELLWRDKLRRHTLSEHGQALMRAKHAPAICARQYFDAIERAATAPQNTPKRLLQAIARVASSSLPSEADLCSTAASINFNSGNPAGRQLLLDVSTIVHGDAKSGIQRVVRSLLGTFLSLPPQNVEVRPIYFHEGSYRYANQLACSVTGTPQNDVYDDPSDFFDGDVYLALDLNMHLAPEMHAQHKRMRSRGVDLYFIIYDLLLLQRPDWWPSTIGPMFQRWLQLSSEVASGLLCISNAVAEEVKDWLQRNPPHRYGQSPEVLSFHLGADVQNSLPSLGVPETAAAVLAQLDARISFLMVGTIEPRKGHAQALEAFELLWARGVQANLVIVGKSGWLVDDLLQKLRNNPENGRKLFWLEGISDEYLEKVYRSSTCLIFASNGEGFGLPLIEAAQHKLPIIARDIPVFREVADGHAFYFDGSSPHELSDAINAWLEMYKTDGHPKSDAMPWLTWKESAQQLLRALNIPPVKKTLN
jgi:glycosyltransferase involved in cell wall biosynthesis